MNEPLTEKQKKILDFIQAFFLRHGYPPTEWEIARNFKIKWVRSVQQYLEALEEKGFIKRGGKMKRGIMPVNAAFGIKMPILGRIAAGKPILAIENIEGHILLDPSIAPPGKTILLRVAGDSMINAGIRNNDLLVVRLQAHAENGEIIAARVNDEVTVKRFKRKKNAILLQPENPAYTAITIGAGDAFEIIGKATTCLSFKEVR